MSCEGCKRRRANLRKLIEEVKQMASRRRTPAEEKALLQLKKDAIDARIKKEDARDKEKELRARIKRMGSR